jgi:hypothetical protein
VLEVDAVVFHGTAASARIRCCRYPDPVVGTLSLEDFGGRRPIAHVSSDCRSVVIRPV